MISLLWEITEGKYIFLIQNLTCYQKSRQSSAKPNQDKNPSGLKILNFLLMANMWHLEHTVVFHMLRFIKLTNSQRNYRRKQS